MGYSRWTNGSNPASMRGGRVWNNSAIYGIIGNNYLWNTCPPWDLFQQWDIFQYNRIYRDIYA